MTTRYCGIGGSDASNGLSWANRKLTLNGLEDTPVAASDICWIGPGVYRELLTIDVSGSAGSPIEFRADVTGQNTDGVGGIVRVTGSDNDTTATRANAITATSKNYRTFRGFSFDTTTSHLVSLITACGNWIAEDCFFAGLGAASINAINVAGTGTTNTFRRCVFAGGRNQAILFTHSSVVDNSAHLVENCLAFGMAAGTAAVRSDRVGGITVKNCTFFGCVQGVRVGTALTSGQTTTVNNCIVAYCTTGMQAVTVPGNEEITENYNSFWGNGTDRSNVTAGANSNAYPPLTMPPLLLAGHKMPWNPFDLSQWSPIRAIAGSSEASDSLYGMTRPATSSKKSRGAVQFVDASRETTTVRNSSAASIKLADAGRHQMFVPVTNVSTVFSVYVQWEADYAGTKPQMVIKQPGQSDVTVLATGSSGAWEQLTTTLTPAALPPYVIVELVSNNTASATNFDVFFEDLTIT